MAENVLMHNGRQYPTIFVESIILCIQEERNHLDAFNLAPKAKGKGNNNEAYQNQVSKNNDKVKFSKIKEKYRIIRRLKSYVILGNDYTKSSLLAFCQKQNKPRPGGIQKSNFIDCIAEK